MKLGGYPRYSETVPLNTVYHREREFLTTRLWTKCCRRRTLLDIPEMSQNLYPETSIIAREHTFFRCPVLTKFVVDGRTLFRTSLNFEASEQYAFGTLDYTIRW